MRGGSVAIGLGGGAARGLARNTKMPVPVVHLSAVQVLGISCLGIALGNALKRAFPILDRLNIPSPIAGGMIFALTTLWLRDRFVNFQMDLVLQNILMIGFFTTIGMGANLELIRKGGAQVVLFFLLASAGAVMQNIVGIALARMFDLSPLLGIISGSVALTGGPATALAFGDTFEKLGISGAATVGVASAMVGITCGGLLGGFIGGRLIDRHKLQPKPRADTEALAQQVVYGQDPVSQPITALADESEGERSPLMASVIAIAVAMALGSLISAWLESRKIVLPAYVGAMIAAAVLRNLDDRIHLLRISQRDVDTIGNISLNIFIVMALLSLQLWQIARLAVPFLVLLACQVLLVWGLCVWMTYRVMGRDYEAAVMSGGFCGFMLGTTANAMACMDVLVQKYGPAPRAFIVVPLVGAFLIDFTNALIVTAMANFFRP